jgi:hypothetical protein
LDNVAKSEFSGTDADSKAKVALYLRPFEFDGCYLMTMPRTGLLHVPTEFEKDFTDICRRSQIALIGLGGVPNSRRLGSAGRASTTDLHWKSKVVEQIERALFVVIVPFSNPGTLWELEFICSNRKWLDKTLFIMPPRPQSLLHAVMNKQYLPFRACVEERWNTVRVELQRMMIQLPVYDEKGGVFRINGYGEAHCVTPLDDMRDSDLERLIVHIVNFRDCRPLRELSSAYFRTFV